MLDRRALLLAGLALPTLARAQSAWKPERPVRLILPFTPGTSMDPAARLAQESLKDALGQSVVVENIAGAATVVAGAEMLKAPPDGHTTLMIANSFAANITLRTRTADWQRAFVPVVQATVVPHVLVAAPALRTDWTGFLKRLREGGGSMTYGSPGIGTSPHLGAEHFLRLAGGKAVHAPYNGNAQLFVDLYAGRIDFALSTLPDVVQPIEEGKLTALAVTAERRVRELLNVPTFAELGLPDLLSDSWFGIMVRRDTPAAARDALERAWLTALARQDVRERLQALSFTVLARPGAEFEKVIDRYVATYAMIIKENGIAVQH
ncbi:tripartite tricarboxylate transporter substrate binding protein [Bosea eneae]|uniref:tripartite tricarboxylate transporter substrate binding protein n=1 Tax=Bosea eneae TaxID=151454 RepID=UPI0036727487